MKRSREGPEEDLFAMVKLRGALLSDLPELAKLDQDIFIGLAYPYFVLRQIFDVHGEEILVADDGGKLLGYSLAVRSSANSKNDLAHYLALGVRAEVRGRGLGRRLAEETLTGLKKGGVRSVRLAVDAANTPAVKLYLSLGFTPVGYEREYYGEKQPRIVLDLNLLASRTSERRLSELARE
ncbi:hypothetical protein ACG83_37015 [Frankia sp. R43]|nr:hypothetical protein ACG83_37015 [Frankia sp. R43]